MLRPGTVYRVAVNVLQAPVTLTVRANIQRNGVEVSSDTKEVKEGIPETLLLKVYICFMEFILMTGMF